MKSYEQIKQELAAEIMRDKEIWQNADSKASMKEEQIKNYDNMLNNMDASTKIRIVDGLIESGKYYDKGGKGSSLFFSGVLTSSIGLTENDPEFKVIQKYEKVNNTPLAAEELLGITAERYGLDLDELLEIKDKLNNGIGIRNGTYVGDLEEYNNPVQEQGKSR